MRLTKEFAEFLKGKEFTCYQARYKIVSCSMYEGEHQSYCVISTLTNPDRVINHPAGFVIFNLIMNRNNPVNKALSQEITEKFTEFLI